MRNYCCNFATRPLSWICFLSSKRRRLQRKQFWPKTISKSVLELSSLQPSKAKQKYESIKGEKEHEEKLTLQIGNLLICFIWKSCAVPFPGFVFHATFSARASEEFAWIAAVRDAFKNWRSWKIEFSKIHPLASTILLNGIRGFFPQLSISTFHQFCGYSFLIVSTPSITISWTRPQINHPPKTFSAPLFVLKPLNAYYYAKKIISFRPHRFQMVWHFLVYGNPQFVTVRIYQPLSRAWTN